MLWQHTRRIREIKSTKTEYKRTKALLKHAKKELEKRRIGVFRFNYANKSLKWYSDVTAVMEQSSWVLDEDLVMAPGSPEEVSISEKETVIIALWAANRAALWLSSQDSKPLLKFIEALDPNVYVL